MLAQHASPRSHPRSSRAATPSDRATCCRDIIELLLARGACTSVLCGSQREPLCCRAARSGRADVLLALVQGGADVQHGLPLCVAAAHGQEECVRVLLAAEARPEAQNGRGETALHLASKAGHTGEGVDEGGLRVGCLHCYACRSTGRFVGYVVFVTFTL